MDFLTASVFSIYVKFLNLLFFDLLDEFTTILLVILLSPLTISLLLAFNIFEANFLNNLVIFQLKINNAAILLKP